MPHLHDLIDFTVSAYIVHDDTVLLVDHTTLKTWMPVGGHIELDEDPEEALVREVKEESGLDVTIEGARPHLIDPGTKALIAPVFMDIHDITETHRHVGLVYFARSATQDVVLAEKEHKDIRWFTAEELGDASFSIRPAVRFYAEEALKKLGL